MPLPAAPPQGPTSPNGPNSIPASPAAITPADITADNPAGCPQCGNLEPWGRSSWCPECGFYPRLGTSLGRATETKPSAELPAAPKSLRETWQQMPAWTKVLCAGILAIFVESIFISVATSDDSLVRSVWGVLQFVIGFSVFVMFHTIAAAKASMANNRIGFLDALLHPVEAWRPTVDGLPQTARRIWLASWGFTAAICATVIVGGIRYSALVDDWGFKKRIDAALSRHVASLNNENPEGTMSLATESAKRGDLDVLVLDCVVVGYNLNVREGVITNLLLASLVDGHLQYVGTVSRGIPDDLHKELVARLAELKRNVPVVKCRASGNWVKPVVAAKVNFLSWNDNRKMVDPEFQELMAEVNYVE